MPPHVSDAIIFAARWLASLPFTTPPLMRFHIADIFADGHYFHSFRRLFRFHCAITLIFSAFLSYFAEATPLAPAFSQIAIFSLLSPRHYCRHWLKLKPNQPSWGSISIYWLSPLPPIHWAADVIQHAMPATTENHHTARGLGRCVIKR
jgi:hypothetical protein